MYFRLIFFVTAFVAITTLGLLYLRHRQQPFHKVAWSLPLVAALIAGSATYYLASQGILPWWMWLQSEFEFSQELDLPKTDRGYKLKPTPLIEIGTDSVVLAPRFKPNSPSERVFIGSHPVDGDQLSKEVRGLPHKGDQSDIITLAVDRCVPTTQVVDVMRHTPFPKFKIALDTPMGEASINTTSPAVFSPRYDDGDLAVRNKIWLTEEGVTLLIDGEPVPAVEGCPDSGPTLCPAGPQNDCRTPFDWQKLREAFVSAGPNPSQVYLLIVAENVRFQTTIDLMATLIVREDGMEWDRENALIRHPLFFVGTSPPPHRPGEDYLRDNFVQ